MMTRREWLNRVIGTVAAAAVAPLVDLTDMTPAFWQQPAVKAAMPWRIVFPDGLTYTFEADVVSEALLLDGTAQFSLRPTGPVALHREMQPVEGQPDTGYEMHEPVPSPDAPATVLSRDGVVLGELRDIGVPVMRRAPIDVDLFGPGDGGDGRVLGMLKREPVTFTVEFQ